VVPGIVTKEDFDEFRQYFDEDQIVEIVAVISLYTFFNRWNDTFATELEETPKILPKSI
jgi:alkylhydroperoxidase family enzyme|tara:strand:- start:638 stop:814 length:177 start_codon:yes stop_codon:yes gene_type:complete